MWRKEHVTGRNGALEILVKGFLRNLGISLRGREAKRAEAVFGVCVCVCVGTCQVASVVSNSLRPHGLKVKVAQSCLTLCDPMDYAVHGILQARILELVTFPFPRGSSQPRNWTQVSCIAGGFLTPWTIDHQSPLSMGFSRKYWGGLPCPPPGYLPNPGIKPTFLMSPALAGEFFSTSSTWEAHAGYAGGQFF